MKHLITDNVLFGIILSFTGLEIGKIISKKLKLSIFNPFLVAVIFIIAALKIFDIPYSSYMLGGNILVLFLGPATIVLGILLYKQIDHLKKHFVAVMVGGIVGCITSAISIILLCKAFGINKMLLISLLPKSITTPVGIELSNMIGGVSSITVIAIAITGVLGGVLSPTICKIAGIKHPIAKGVAIGTSSHIIGTSKAIEMGEIEGAMSATSIVVCAIITLVIVPISIKFL